MHPWSRVEQSLGRRAGLDRPSAEQAGTPPQPERDERDSVDSWRFDDDDDDLLLPKISNQKRKRRTTIRFGARGVGGGCD